MSSRSMGGTPHLYALVARRLPQESPHPPHRRPIPTSVKRRHSSVASPVQGYRLPGPRHNCWVVLIFLNDSWERLEPVYIREWRVRVPSSAQVAAASSFHPLGGLPSPPLSGDRSS